MKFCAIPPVKHLDLTHLGDIYFGLAHLCVSNLEYKNFFLRLSKGEEGVKNRYSHIILDNSAAEHSLVNEDVLLHLVEEICPNEVIAPDVLFDKKQTISNLHSFIEKMKSWGQDLSAEGLLHQTDIFACPQGSTKEEWLDCYEEMLDNPYVKIIGLSKIAVPKCWNNATGDKMIGESRNRCVAELMERDLLKKPLHLLGMGEHTEFDFYLKNKVPNIRSSDSCYTILAAINNIDFSDGNTKRIPTTNEYFGESLSTEQMDLAIKNINFLKTKYKQI
jgi:hypothetical protein